VGPCPSHVNLSRFGTVSDRTDWLALTGFLVELFVDGHFATIAEECHPLGSAPCEDQKLPMPDWLNRPCGTSTRYVPKNAAAPTKGVEWSKPPVWDYAGILARPHPLESPRPIAMFGAGKSDLALLPASFKTTVFLRRPRSHGKQQSAIG